MGEIQVQTPELAVASGTIRAQAAEIEAAQGAVNAAQGEIGAFGGEPIGASFLNMCAQASRAAAEYETTINALSHNVAMASLGYVNTDEGVIPVEILGKAGQNP